MAARFFAALEIVVTGMSVGHRVQHLVRLQRGLERSLALARGGEVLRLLPQDKGLGASQRDVVGIGLPQFVDQLAARIALGPLEAIAAAKRAVDAALDERVDVATGLRIEDQLLRETVARPATRELLKAIVAAGAQTRDFELGNRRR